MPVVSRIIVTGTVSSLLIFLSLLFIPLYSFADKVQPVPEQSATPPAEPPEVKPAVHQPDDSAPVKYVLNQPPQTFEIANNFEGIRPLDGALFLDGELPVTPLDLEQVFYQYPDKNKSPELLPEIFTGMMKAFGINKDYIRYSFSDGSELVITKNHAISVQVLTVSNDGQLLINEFTQPPEF